MLLTLVLSLAFSAKLGLALQTTPPAAPERVLGLPAEAVRLVFNEDPFTFHGGAMVKKGWSDLFPNAGVWVTYNSDGIAIRVTRVDVPLAEAPAPREVKVKPPAKP